MESAGKNKIWKRIAYIAGTFIILYFIGNLGINYWMKHNLPRLINQESPYFISYKTIDVGLATRSFSLEDVKISSKKGTSQEQLQIDGSIKHLKISQIGITNALLHKVLRSGNVSFENPNLKIVLPKSENDKIAKQQSIYFNKINIKQGKIDIFRYNKDSLLSIDKLNVNITNFELTEQGVKKKLPVVFDEYNISGENFIYKESDAYDLKARSISTQKGQISIKDFQLVPLLNREEFEKKFPHRTYLFGVKTKEISFKDIEFKNNTLYLSQIKLTQPFVKIMATHSSANTVSNSAQGNFDYNISLKNVTLENGALLMEKTDGSPLLQLARLDADINEIVMDAETTQKEIPFKYKSYHFSAKNIKYTPENMEASISSVLINDKNMTIRNILYKSMKGGSQNLIKIPEMALRNYNYSFENGKGFLTADSLNLNNIYATVNTGIFDNHKSAINNKNSSTKLEMKLGHLGLNGTIILNKENDQQLVKLNNLKAEVNNLVSNDETMKQPIPLKYDNFKIETRNFNYVPNNYSQLSATSVVLTDKNLHIRDFNFVPTKTRAQFLASLKTQEDLYIVKIPEIDLINYHYFKSKGKSQVIVDQLNIQNLYTNIFSYNGEHPPKDNTPRTFFNTKLRNIKFPFAIKKTQIKNATLVYEETDDNATAPGKLTFKNLNADIDNINSAKIPDNKTLVSINAQTKFLETAPTQVFWSFDVADKTDGFTFNANINQLDASRINDFIKSYLHVSASGYIDNINFKYSGNNTGIHGPFQMSNRNLKVELLNKNTNEKKGFLSTLANWFVKSNSQSGKNQFQINQPRTEKRSFFNLLWKGMESGLSKSVLGEGTDKTVKDVSNVVTDFKTVFGPEENKKPQEKQEKKFEEPQKEEKPNFFKRIFNKKK